MPFLRLFSALLLLATIGGCSLLINFDAPGEPEGRWEALFTHPSVDGTLDDGLAKRLGELIDGAASGSTVRAAVSDLSSDLVGKLAAAHNRGVTVEVVSEDCPASDEGICTAGPSSALQSLQAALPAGGLLFCHQGCLGSGRNRQEFWIFQQLSDGDLNVVAQTSQPLNGEMGLFHQQLLLRHGDRGLAAAYQSAFERMKRGEAGTWNEESSFDGGTTAWFSPRDAAADLDRYGSADRVAAAIQAVICQATGQDAGRVRLAVSEWDAARTEMLQALLSKKEEGCSVKVLLQGGASSEAAALPLAAAEVPVEIFRPGGCRNSNAAAGCLAGGLQANWLLLESAGGGEQRVLTGSSPLAGAAFGADEALLQVQEEGVYQAFSDEFASLEEEALKVLPNRYPDAGLEVVPTQSGMNEHHPAMATNSTGYLAIAWEAGPSASAPTGTEIYLQLWKDGVRQYETKVSDGSGSGTNSTWSHIQPRVGLDSAGNAYVTWAWDNDGNGAYEAAVRKVQTDGTLGVLTNANSGASTGDQFRPSIAVRPDGSFTVVWQNSANNQTSIGASGFDSTGTRVYGPLVVTGPFTAPASYQWPDVASAPVGDSVVVWQEDVDGDGLSNIGMAQLSAAGVVTALPLANARGANDQNHPAIAMRSSGEFVVAWASTASGSSRIALRGFNSAGAEQFPEREVTGDVAVCDPTLGAQAAPDLAVDSTGQWVVAWEEQDNAVPSRGLEIYARRFNADGTPSAALPALRMSPVLFNDQHEPAVALGSGGEVFLGFTDDYNGNGHGDLWLRTGLGNN